MIYYDNSDLVHVLRNKNKYFYLQNDFQTKLKQISVEKIENASSGGFAFLGV